MKTNHRRKAGRTPTGQANRHHAPARSRWKRRGTRRNRRAYRQALAQGGLRDHTAERFHEGGPVVHVLRIGEPVLCCVPHPVRSVLDEITARVRAGIIRPDRGLEAFVRMQVGLRA